MKKIFLIIIIFLVACEKEKVEEKVIGKKYKPEHYETRISYQLAGKIMIPIQRKVKIEEEYILIVNEIKTSKKEIAVGKEEFENIKIGEYRELKK